MPRRTISKRIALERLKKVLHYDPLTGVMTNLIDRRPKIRAGSINRGHANSTGYLQMCIDGTNNAYPVFTQRGDEMKMTRFRFRLLEMVLCSVGLIIFDGLIHLSEGAPFMSEFIAGAAAAAFLLRGLDALRAATGEWPENG